MNDPLNWAVALPILERALELPPDERARFVEAADAADPRLREEILRMLDEEARDDAFLAPAIERPGAVGHPAAHWSAAPGVALGPYRLVERVGEGGMGEVWLARRLGEGFEQHVAVKLIRLGMHTEDVLLRFRNERRVLASLTHPNIPRLLDGGATPDGRPFLVMEFVEGVPLDEFPARANLDLRERLELFLEVCDAVAHAHDRAVVHRDLKASNVLVSQDGRPRLLDFGIAKVLADNDGLGALDLTRTGHHLLTPRAASPEQIRGEPVGPETDVYALGLLLWQMLIGEPPPPLDALTSAELEEAVCETPVPPPSTHAGSRALRRRLQGDLDTIVGMALRKEPARRYASARELSEDLRRHLEQRPIRARKDTALYRTSRFVERHRALVMGTLTTFAVLVLGLVLTVSAYLEVARAELVSRRSSYSASLHAAEAAVRDGRAGVARARLDAAPAELQGWEWRHLSSRLERGTVIAPPARGAPSGGSVAWRASGALLFTSERGVVVMGPGEARVLEWTAAHSRVDVCRASGCVAASDTAGRVWIEDAPGAARRPAGLHPKGSGALPGVLDLAWSPDGARLAISRADGSVSVVHTGSGHVSARFERHAPSSRAGRLGWHPGGELLASAGWDETVQLYDAVSGTALGGWRAHTMCVEGLDFSPDGGSLVTASMDSSVIVWDVTSRRATARLRGHDREVQSVRFLPGGDRVVTGDAGGVLRLTDVESEATITHLIGHAAAIADLDVDPEGRELASVDDSGEVRTWNLDARDLRSVRGCEYSRGLAFAPDGSRFALTSPDGRLRVWDRQGLELLCDRDLECGMLESLDWSAAGHRLVVGTQSGRVVVVDARSLEIEGSFEASANPITAIAVDRAGEHVWLESAAGNREPRRAARWRLNAPRCLEEREVPGSAAYAMDLVLGPSGEVVASADGTDAIAFVLDRGGALRPVGDPRAVRRPSTASVDGDERTVAASFGERVVVYDVESARTISTWTTDGVVRRVALRPGGSRVAVACEDRLEIWDPRIPLRVATLREHAGWISAIAWSSDGEALATAASDGRVVLWETH